MEIERELQPFLIWTGLYGEHMDQVWEQSKKSSEPIALTKG